MPHVALDYGAADPLALDLVEGTIVEDLRGPEGVVGEAAIDLVRRALAQPGHGPPLGAHVVPGDRVVVALSGEPAQAGQVTGAIVERLRDAGVAGEEVSVLQAVPGDQAASPAAERFDPTAATATSYLAADEAGRPLYVARRLVDADVVVAVGGWGWNAALGGRSLEGELWPAFGQVDCRRELARSLARRGRLALADWRTSLQEITWQLGVCASLRLVAGRAGTLHAAVFGLPDEACRLAREAARGWCPRIDDPVDLAIAAVPRPGPSCDDLVRAVAAAARVTRPGGTICVASRLATPPGLIFLRWRQGAPLERLVHEAVAARDEALVADAVLTRLFARALGERRLVLLSDLDEAAVEEFGFGHADSPEVIERLAHGADSVALLHDADRMLPRAG